MNISREWAATTSLVLFMWGSKKPPRQPPPPPPLLTAKAEFAIAGESDEMWLHLRHKIREEGGWVDGVVDGLDEHDRVLALWSGSPDAGGTRPRGGTFLLTNRELFWRNLEGVTFHVELASVDQLNMVRVGQYALHCVLVHGAHETPLVVLGETPKNNRGAIEFYEALEEAIRAARGAARTTASAAAPASVADELEKLAALKDRGVLTDTEFAAQKRSLLGG